MAEDEGVARGERRLDLLGVELPLVLVGGEDHDQVGLLRCLARGEDAQALGLGLVAALRAGLQADPDVDAGVAQGQRVGVALAAVADDRDVLALDQAQVGVVVVEHLSHWGLSFGWFLWVVGFGSVSWRWRKRGRARRPGAGALADRARAATDGDHARLHELADAEGLQHAQQVGELVGVADGLDGDRVGGDVDDLGAEELDGVEHRAAGGGVGPDLDEQQLAVDRPGAVELDDLDHLDELVELLGDLLERGLVDVDHDGHPRDLGVLGRADGEAVDVVAAAREQARDAGQDAGLVLDQDGQGVLVAGARIRCRPRRTGAPGRART